MRETYGRARDGIELKLDNRQIVSLVIGTLIVLGLVFAIGVLTGKQLAGAPEAVACVPPPEDRLAELDAQAKAAQAAPPPPARDAELTFAQELTRPSPAPEIAAVPEPPRAEPARVTPEPAPVAAPKATPAPAVPAPSAKAPDARRSDLAAAFDLAGATSPGGRFAVQIASLPSERAAEGEVQRLAAKGITAWIAAAEVAGKGTVFRVKVGPYETRADAKAAMDDIATRIGTQPIITNAK